jgi:hypothetical protein
MLMHTKSKRLVIGLLVLILIGGVVWLFTSWWFENFEEIPYTERTEMSPEARRNPLLAAEKLLSRLGHEVESKSGRKYLVDPPQEIGVLLVRDLGAPLPQKRVDNLLSWVEAGGHLIATPGKLQDNELERPLLLSFGVDFVYQSELQELDWVKELVEEAKKASDQVADEAQTTSMLLPGDEEAPVSIEIDSDSWFNVDYPYTYWQAPAEERPHLLIFPFGEGYVTFLSDNGFFDNLRLGDYDHAVLLAELTAGYDRVWLLYSAQMPGLIQLIWRWAPYLVVSLALLIILLIWQMTRRSGPLILSGQRQRRDLLEHLQASAQFNWRIDPKAGLLQQVRRQVEKRWLTSHPPLQRLDRAGRCQWLAEHTGMTAEAIDLALYRSLKETGQLVKTTANLQRLMVALRSQSNKR